MIQHSNFECRVAEHSNVECRVVQHSNVECHVSGHSKVECCVSRYRMSYVECRVANTRVECRISCDSTFEYRMPCFLRFECQMSDRSTFEFCMSNAECFANFMHRNEEQWPGPSCSKLTMSLVSVSLKLCSLNMIYTIVFLLKKCE